MPTPDIAAISAISASLRTSLDIATAMIGLRDAEKMRLKVIELTAQIIAAQQSALTAQTAQSELVQRERELEDKIMKLEDWDREKQRYQLKRLGTALVYETKPGMENGEPTHQICPNCYELGKKSILQNMLRRQNWEEFLVCLSCKAEVCVVALRDAYSKQMLELEYGSGAVPSQQSAVSLPAPGGNSAAE